MRSQGIILLGAQQQASLVSTRVFENAGVKALGRSGSMEMGRDVWRFLGDSARRKAAGPGQDGEAAGPGRLPRADARPRPDAPLGPQPS